MTAGLSIHLVGLLNPRAYSHAVERVQLIETHISWILLAGEFAYKIKRPVHYPFIDLRERQRRDFYCAEELRLNRRFAPQLYLDVVQITSVDGEARIGPGGEVIEHAVRMRRFDRSQELDQLLEAKSIEPAELERFGRRLARLHASLPVAADEAPWGGAGAVRKLLVDNIEQTVQAGIAVDFEADMLARLDALAPVMAARVAGGRIRECHGDLHARNIVRLRDELVAFDCMEFEPAFRWIDVAEEIGFLVADLQARGFGGFGQAFLNGYLAHSGDYGACRMLCLYKAHHALVRAKVNALSGIRSAPDRYLETARSALAGRVPMLVLISGLSGSGKTWLARELAMDLEAVHLRSDVERKRLAGLKEHARSAAGLREGLYSPANSERVYEALAAEAQEVLAAGYPVLVDATFLRRQERSSFVRLAARLGIALRLVRCIAPLQVLRERIAHRSSDGQDASEATTAVLDWQIAHQEPIQAQEGIEVLEVDTSAEKPARSRAELIAWLRSDRR